MRELPPSAPRDSFSQKETQNDHTLALRELASKLVIAEVRERRRIAEDLHDHLGQYLALARMKLSTLQGNTMFCGYEKDLIEIENLLEKAIHYTRHMTKVMSPPVLYELGLAPALEWLSEQYSQRHGLTINFTAHPSIPEFEEDIRGMIYRSIRELLINIVKHAGASTVDLQVGFDGRDVCFRLRDDGRGFEPGDLRPSSTAGFGLFSIRERMTHLGGKLELTSSPGNGTTVSLTCPVEMQACG